MRCSICGKVIKGYGHSVSPLEGGACCDKCNIRVVLPVRLFLRTIDSKEYALLIKEKEVDLVKPDNKYFTLKEHQDAVEGYIQVVSSVFTGFLDVVNEEGLLKNLYFNNIAHMLFQREYVGNVLICPVRLFEAPEEE